MYKQAGEASRRLDAEPKFVYFACFSIKPKTTTATDEAATAAAAAAQSNNKKNICIKQQTAHRFEGGGRQGVGRPQTEVNESLPGERVGVG